MHRTIAGVCLALLWASGASATPITFSLSGVSSVTGNILGAMATFGFDGDYLIVTLQNTGGEASAPEDVLTGVFFDIAGSPELVPLSAVLGSGSAILFETLSPDFTGDPDDLSGEWAFAEGLSGTPGGGAYGIATTGYDSANLFGSKDVFNTDPTLNRNAHQAPDGLDYGIVSDADDITLGNSAVTGGQAYKQLIQDTVVFTLGLPDFWLDDYSGAITHVAFQYGTSLDAPSLIPEPTTLLLLGTGLAMMARRRRSRTRAPQG